MDIFGRKKNLRVMRIGNIERLQEFVGKTFVDLKSLIDGGLIAQWSFVPVTRGAADLALAECDYKGKRYRVNRAADGQGGRGPALRLATWRPG